MTALLSTMLTEWAKGRSFRLWLMSAVTIPALARPNQMATYSGRFSSMRATVSPAAKPDSSNRWANLLLSSLICKRTNQKGGNQIRNSNGRRASAGRRNQLRSPFGKSILCFRRRSTLCPDASWRILQRRRARSYSCYRTGELEWALANSAKDRCWNKKTKYKIKIYFSKNIYKYIYMSVGQRNG